MVESNLFKTFYLNFPITNWDCKLSNPGYYAIWIKNIQALRDPFKQELTKRSTNLLYIGIAEHSLTKRLFEEELQHRSPATYYRAIGAILGYRPETGSLIGKKNKNNYKFSKTNTESICEWIDKNISVSFHATIKVNTATEKFLIKKYIPLLNWTHNPAKFQPLKILRKECREIGLNHS